jgi:hypothetical protein
MKLIRILAALAAAAAGVLVLAASASADPPVRDVWTDAFEFDDASTCPGTTIHWAYSERDTFVEFSPTKVIFQRHGVAILTVNDKTLTHNFSATVFVDPTSDVLQVDRTVFNIEAPGVGNLLVDAGNIVVDNSTDPPTVLHIGGPHPQFSGDVAALCDYLADP